ncbi:glycoside hydrolase family 2 protein [Phycisphaerales bacterium AB-hyl4]|uniref:Glycoside hydrolase family 2 protein n=1 Tax=Natronomicrosphaera hydrolytica TaxID=3242702 RepID=A0ABV4U2W5_9BACT
MRTIDLNSQWRLADYPLNAGLAGKAYRRDHAVAADAMNVDLPKIAQAALFEHGRLPDPYVDFNSDAYKWVEEKEWWYFRDFVVPTREEDERVFVRFEGITYRADVWVNGHLVGHIEGMFRLDEFDITDALDATGDNRLAVRVRTQENAWQDDRGSSVRGKVRSQGVVAQAMYRWNWCPHLVGVGIWQPVSLVVREPVEIEQVRVRTIAVQTDQNEDVIPAEAPAEIEIAWDLVNRGNAPATAEVTYDIDGETFALSQSMSGTVQQMLGPGESTTVRKRIKLDHARLWWCNGLGDAHLYRLNTRLRGTRGDDQTATFGVREIRFVENEDMAWVTQVSGHTARPWTMIHPLYNWVLSLNGRRVFLKGSNWVHADVLLRLDRSRYERLLRPAKVGGLNFMRVWGGSLAETDAFYDVCDRLGLLCWQEFWLACENYPALDRQLLARCARDTVRRLYNRPSLVFYSGGNEFEPDNIENKSAVDTLAAVVAETDDSRPFRRSSPYKGDKHGGLVPTPTAIRNKYLDILPGDKRQVLFRSEVAVGRSAPMFASLDKFITPQWPLDEKQFRHFFGVPSEFIGFASEYAADDSYTHAVLANHFAHVRVLQVNVEYCRMQMFRCSGHLNWQYSVPWPCLHREIVDWWGLPKPAFYHYVTSSKPLALLVDLEKYLWDPGETLDVPICLVNDGVSASSLQCEVDVIDTQGNVVHQWRASADIDANAARTLDTLAWQIPEHLAERTLFLFTRLRRDGQTFFQNAYWIAVSNLVHTPDALRLDGPWTDGRGNEISLPGNDMQLGDDGFESIVQKNVERDFEQTAEDRSGDGATETSVRYCRTFTLPEALRGKSLAFFCPGIEASWEVIVNGQSLGSRELRGSSLDLGAMAHVPWGGTQPDARLDSKTDYKFFSDPITLPRLEPCFVDIPDGLLKTTGENKIVLQLKTDCQKVVSQSMFIRERTPNREAVVQHRKRGVLFRDMRDMPSAEVKIEADQSSITVHNSGETVAVMLLLDVEVDVDGTSEAIATDDNALMLVPGERREIRPLAGGTFPARYRLTVQGWNVSKTVAVVEASG